MASGNSDDSDQQQLQQQQQQQQQLPKGVVLGPDGKPCRTCTSAASWRALARMSAASSSSPSSPSSSTSTSPSSSASASEHIPPSPPSPATLEIPADCPPDVEALGRSSWTLLHTIAATYPPRASPAQQSDMQSFLALFGKLYPCWFCAGDFRVFMERQRPRVEGRSELGNWMCEAHNEVNRKLGKKEFDCSRWEERWRTGWKDGRCD